jgi:LmbE family N-acetylglucosaminyl deacetylase
MSVFALLLTLIIAFPFAAWILLFLFASDLSLPTEDPRKFKNVLFIFPHPDDETLTAGGLIYQLSQIGALTTLLTLTKGEKGTSDAHLDVSLKKTRTAELYTVAKILGASEVVLKDMGDGELSHQKNEMKRVVNETLSAGDYDLVVTYDQSGLYGHPDHIALSEVVTEVVQQKFSQVSLWYAAQPKRVMKLIKLPEHMAQDPQFRSKRMVPNIKIFAGFGVWRKILAEYAYKSQFSSFQRGMPLPFIPVWYFVSFGVYEYFYRVK